MTTGKHRGHRGSILASHTRADEARHRTPSASPSSNLALLRTPTGAPGSLRIRPGRALAAAAVTALTLGIFSTPLLAGGSQPAVAEPSVHSVRMLLAERDREAQRPTRGYDDREIAAAALNVDHDLTLLHAARTEQLRLIQHRTEVRIARAEARAAARRKARIEARRKAREARVEARRAAAAKARAAAAKAAAKAAAEQAAAQAAAQVSPPVAPGSVQALAHKMMLDYGYSPNQWAPLNSLIERESDYNVTATNPTSGAYGIPQALPGSKMASAGTDWQTNPATQIRWMLDYIKSRYGTPAAAWAHSCATGWY